MGLLIRCINLDRRADRWARCEAIGHATPGVEFVRQRAIEIAGRPWIACTLGHQIAVFEAKLRDDPWVIVAEDDIEFTGGFSTERFRALIEAADRLELGALYTGTVSYAQEIVAVHGGIIETDAYMSSHLTVYFARAYDAVLHWPIGWGSDYGRDPAVHSDAHDRMRTAPPVHIRRALTLPFLSIQREDVTDNVTGKGPSAAHWRDAEGSWASAVQNR